MLPPPPELAYLILGLMTLGTGLIFLWHDGKSAPSRSLSYCLMAIGFRLFLSGNDAEEGHYSGLWFVSALCMILEMVAFFTALEWGRRIGKQAAAGRLVIASSALFRAAQVLVLISLGLNLGYLMIFPELAATDSSGLVSLRGVEFAVFAPILGTSVLLAGIAIATLSVSKIDYAEIVRLRALSIAGPCLIGAMIFGGDLVAITISLGLLVFLSGSVRYLIIQGQRGQFMKQFLSPEVAKLVQQEGVDSALQQQRRLLSVVVCDLRGFTRYASQHDSAEVVKMLEQFYRVVGQVAARYGGTVKDHAGDGVLILVGAPIALPDHAQRGLELAQQLQQEMRSLLETAEPALGLGVGVATGNVTIGAIRAARRLEYVAVGNPVNLAARLCDRAEPGEVLCDTRSLDELGDGTHFQVEERPPQPLKGFAEPIPVRALR